jgi:PGF-CTERM protein
MLKPLATVVWNMRTVLLLAGLLMTSAVAGVAPAAAQPDEVTLTVSVVTDSGTSVGDATVEATWDDGSATVETASNGKAFVDVPEGADIEVNAESADFIRNRPVVVEDASEREITVEVASKGQLTVTANDTEGPVAEARVRLRVDGEVIVEGETDAGGEFTTPEVEQGDYFLEVFKRGYYRNLTREEVGADTSLQVSMRRGTTNVQFRVVDDHFSPPRQLSDARVEVEGIGTQQLTGGTVTFTVSVNTRYSVTATGDGYATNTTSLFVGAEGGSQTLVINREPALNLTAANGRVVVGETVQVTVRNEYDQRVSNATVRLDGEAVATTGAEGTAGIAIDTGGEHAIIAETDGVTSNEVSIQGVATATSATPTATATATTTMTPEPPTAGLPGFTPVAAVVALLAVALLVRRAT